jgi:hypothetical protein
VFGFQQSAVSLSCSAARLILALSQVRNARILPKHPFPREA